MPHKVVPMTRSNSVLLFACCAVSLAGCWVHTEPDHPHRDDHREVIVHPENRDVHHDDVEHHDDHDDHH